MDKGKTGEWKTQVLEVVLGWPKTHPITVAPFPAWRGFWPCSGQPKHQRHSRVFDYRWPDGCREKIPRKFPKRWRVDFLERPKRKEVKKRYKKRPSF